MQTLKSSALKWGATIGIVATSFPFEKHQETTHGGDAGERQTTSPI